MQTTGITGIHLRTCTDSDETTLLTAVAEDMINYALHLRGVVRQAVDDLRAGTPAGPVADHLQTILDDDEPPLGTTRRGDQ